MKRVVQLAGSHGVVVVQETHDDGFKHKHLKFLLRHFHLCHWSSYESSGRSGGCAIIMRGSPLNLFNRHYIHEICPGRGMLFKASGDQGDLQLICVHIDPAGTCGEQIAHVSDIASKVACCDRIAICILGDLNLEIDFEDRVDVTTGKACAQLDRLARHWSEKSGSLAELHQADPTRAPIVGEVMKTASRIDRVHGSLHTSVLRVSDIRVHTLGSPTKSFGRLSNHVPVAAYLRVRQRRPAGFEKPIALWICKHLAFGVYLDHYFRGNVLPSETWGRRFLQGLVSRSCCSCDGALGRERCCHRRRANPLASQGSERDQTRAP